jgi:hypothetical protein
MKSARKKPTAAKLARHPVVTMFKSGLFPEIMRRCWPQNEVSC